MIVKNEAHVILRSLGQLVKYIDYWVILDTGSTDGTPELIQQFFEAENIPGEIHHTTWRDDFGWARSEALKLCQGRVDYAWVFDADDTIIGEFVLPELTADAYQLVFKNHPDGLSYWRESIFRIAAGWYYEYVLHEQPRCRQARYRVEPIHGSYYINSGRDGARSQVADKFERDALIIERALENITPKQREAYKHYTYFLGQSYYDCQDYALAAKNFRLRLTLDKDDQAFRAHLYLMDCEAQLGLAEEDLILGYLECAKHYPHYLEPLWHAALLYAKQNQLRAATEVLERGRHIMLPKVYMALEAPLYRWQLVYTLASFYQQLGELAQAHQVVVDLLARTGPPDHLPPPAAWPELFRLKFETQSWECLPWTPPPRRRTGNVKLYLVGLWNWDTWRSLQRWTDFDQLSDIIHLNWGPEAVNLSALHVKSIQICDEWTKFVRGDWAIVIPTGWICLDRRAYIQPAQELLQDTGARRLFYNHGQGLEIPRSCEWSKRGYRYLTHPAFEKLEPSLYHFQSPTTTSIAWHDVTILLPPHHCQQVAGSYLVIRDYNPANHLFQGTGSWTKYHQLTQKLGGTGFDIHGSIKQDILDPADWLDMRELGHSSYRVFLLRSQLPPTYRSWGKILQRSTMSLVVERVRIHGPRARMLALREYYHEHDWWDVDTDTRLPKGVYIYQTTSEVIDWEKAAELTPLLERDDWRIIHLSDTAELRGGPGTVEYTRPIMRTW